MFDCVYVLRGTPLKHYKGFYGISLDLDFTYKGFPKFRNFTRKFAVSTAAAVVVVIVVDAVVVVVGHSIW